MASNFRQFVQFYFIGLILSFIILVIVGAKVHNILINPAFYILPFVFSLVGFGIGLVIYELKLRPPDKKVQLFSIGYSIGVLALLVVISIVMLDNLKRLKHKDNFGNVETNHDVMKTWVNENEGYIRIAFNRLEKEFKNPNDFELDAFSVRTRDTIINGIQDTIYNVYFVYFPNTDRKNKYFSKVSVLNSKPELKIYNADTRTNEEYKRIKAEKEEQEYEMMKNLKDLNDTLKSLEDS